MSQKDKLLVANGQGFWGDSILGPVRLVHEGPLDYLTLDYLAEVTMSIMQKLSRRDPAGRLRDRLRRMLDRVLPTCREKGHQDHRQRRRRQPEACVQRVARGRRANGDRAACKSALSRATTSWPTCRS